MSPWSELSIADSGKPFHLLRLPTNTIDHEAAMALFAGPHQYLRYRRTRDAAAFTTRILYLHKFCSVGHFTAQPLHIPVTMAAIEDQGLYSYLFARSHYPSMRSSDGVGGFVAWRHELPAPAGEGLLCSNR